MKYTFLYLIFGASFLLFTSCKQEAKEQISKKPNIVFIMSDDHAYQAISAYDDKLINTPSIVILTGR